MLGGFLDLSRVFWPKKVDELVDHLGAQLSEPPAWVATQAPVVTAIGGAQAMFRLVPLLLGKFLFELEDVNECLRHCVDRDDEALVELISQSVKKLHGLNPGGLRERRRYI